MTIFQGWRRWTSWLWGRSSAPWTPSPSRCHWHNGFFLRPRSILKRAAPREEFRREWIFWIYLALFFIVWLQAIVNSISKSKDTKILINPKYAKSHWKWIISDIPHPATEAMYFSEDRDSVWNQPGPEVRFEESDFFKFIPSTSVRSMAASLWKFNWKLKGTKTSIISGCDKSQWKWNPSKNIWRYHPLE